MTRFYFNLSEIKASHGILEDQKVLLSLSRLSYEKNIQAIITGFYEILQTDKRYRLMIVGDGPYKKELEKLVEQLDIVSYVIFVGEVNNQLVNRYYQLADYFVSLSDSESQGLTYIEALAAKTPIIAKQTPYLNQLIDHESLGLLLEDEESFAEEFMANEYKLKKESELFETKLMEISSEMFGNKVEAFYEELIAQHESRRDKTLINSSKQLIQTTFKVVKRSIKN